MNLQQIFDRGVTQIRTQGKLSFYHDDEHGSNVCQYRSKDGSMCALGPSIPNDKYKPEFDWEGYIPIFSGEEDDWSYHLALAVGCESQEDCEIVREFQQCHDDAAKCDEGVEGFLIRARSFARAHKLNTECLDAAQA